MPELQTIPARHGVATFVPAGQVIKVINTSGSQAIDTWAFALPVPDGKKGEKKDELVGEKANPAQTKQSQSKSTSTPAKPALAKKNKKANVELPSQEDAEQATRDGFAQATDQAGKDSTAAESKRGWGSYVPTSYVPSLGFGKKKNDDAGKEDDDEPQAETEQQKNSKTWASYFPSGKGFSSYIPKQASDRVSHFASIHQRDSSKSYLDQLTAFSKTPVGATGLAAMTGSGYTSSLYAGYSAWSALTANAPSTEFMSMPHTRSSTKHLTPLVNDTLVTNLSAPILTLIEDSSPGKHNTLLAACDPRWHDNADSSSSVQQQQQQQGEKESEDQRSCAANLVLALHELNARAGLKGAKAIGAQVSVENVPAPLGLFRNVHWDENGEILIGDGKATKEGSFVRLRAERDAVIVLCACPMDANGAARDDAEDAAFVVEEGEEEEAAAAIKRVQTSAARPQKINKKNTVLRKAGATAVSGGDDGAKQNSSSSSSPPMQKKQKNPPPSTKPPPPRKTLAHPAATPAASQSTPAQ